MPEYNAPGGSGDSSPLTTKGDLYTFDTGNTRLPVGTDGHVLLAASGETTGLKWGLSQGQVILLMLLTTKEVREAVEPSTPKLVR